MLCNKDANVGGNCDVVVDFSSRLKVGWLTVEETRRNVHRGPQGGYAELASFGHVDQKETLMLKNLIKLVKDEDGITAMEYGLLAAAIAGVLILVAFFFSNRLGNAINNVSAHIN